MEFVHGQAVATMLPHVIRFNGSVCADAYAELWRSCPWGQREPADGTEAVARLASFVTDLVQLAGLETRLEPQGVLQEALPDLAADAAEQWTGKHNPRPVDQDTLLSLYRQAF